MDRVRRLNLAGTHTLPGVGRLKRLVVGGSASSSIEIRLSNDAPLAILDGTQGSYDLGFNIPATDDIEVVIGNVSVELDGGSSSDDVLAEGSHGLSDGDRIAFSSLTGGAGLSAGTTYFVVNATTGTFQLATEAGGTAIDFTTDITAATYEEVVDVTVIYA